MERAPVFPLLVLGYLSALFVASPLLYQVEKLEVVGKQKELLAVADLVSHERVGIKEVVCVKAGYRVVDDDDGLGEWASPILDTGDVVRECNCGLLALTEILRDLSISQDLELSGLRNYDLNFLFPEVGFE